MTTQELDDQTTQAFIAWRKAPTTKIEYYNFGRWNPGVSSIWTPGVNYRIAQPTITEWTFETAPLTLALRRKRDGEIYRAVTYPSGVRVSNLIMEVYNVTYAQLLTDFAQLDGKPCGTEVK